MVLQAYISAPNPQEVLHGKRTGMYTGVVDALVPVRVTGHIALSLLLMVLLSPAVEHLFEELELRESRGDQGQKRE